MKPVIVFSHGFGVRVDYLGLLPDLAKSLSGYQTVLFDYNHYDATHNVLTVSPLDQQAKLLNKQIENVRSKGPRKVNLICHSQGCVVACLAKLKGIDKVVFLAPPQTIGGDKIKEVFKKRAGAVYDPDNMSSLPRRDGSVTQIPAGYWKSLGGLDAKSIYQQMADSTDLTIITAGADDVLGETDFSDLRLVKLLQVEGADHNFTGPARQQLVDLVREVFRIS